MIDVAKVEQNDIWSCASAEALQRTVLLASRAVEAPIALLSSFTAGAQVLRGSFGIERGMPDVLRSGALCRRVFEGAQPLVHTGKSAVSNGAVSPDDALSYMGVPLHLSSGQAAGTLCVADFRARAWTAKELEIIDSIAAFLVSDLELRSDLLRPNVGLHATSGNADPTGGHELRTPLQAIVGHTDLLLMETRADVIGEHTRQIRAAAESMLTIVDRTQAVGRFLDVSAQTIVAASQEAVTSGDGDLASDIAEAGTRILLADDLDLNRKLIADMLGTDGHVVDCVADGAEAVKAAAQRQYDVILMDMIMPGMDGIAATREIRKLPAPACDVPILALTAHAFKDQLDSCLTAGMNATLTKPMSLEALTSAVSSWTRKRKAA